MSDEQTPEPAPEPVPEVPPEESPFAPPPLDFEKRDYRQDYPAGDDERD